MQPRKIHFGTNAIRVSRGFHLPHVYHTFSSSLASSIGSWGILGTRLTGLLYYFRWTSTEVEKQSSTVPRPHPAVLLSCWKATDKEEAIAAGSAVAWPMSMPQATMTTLDVMSAATPRRSSWWWPTPLSFGPTAAKTAGYHIIHASLPPRAACMASSSPEYSMHDASEAATASRLQVVP